MHFIINSRVNTKIREFLQININTNLLTEKREEILIKCKNKELILYSNNGSTECKLIFEDSEFKYKKQGESIINSKILLSLLENLRTYPEIEFQKLENSFLRVISDKFECSLVNLVKKVPINLDFFNYSYEKITFEFNFLNSVNNKFKDFYKSVGSSIQKNTVFNTVNFRKTKNSEEITVIVTDSYRILLASFPSPSFLEDKEFEFNLPTEILNSIVILFKDYFESRDINFYIDNENLLVNSNNVVFKTKLYIGNYPNLIDLFYSEEKLNFLVNKNLLISAIDRNLFLSEQKLNITLYRIEGNNLILEYKDSSKGFSREEIEIKKNKGDNIQFSLNSLFLKQLVKNISDQDIVFSISETYKPIILYGKEEKRNFKQIILPLKYS